MNGEGKQTRRARPRPLDPPQLPPGPLRDLKTAVYDLYLLAEAPTLDEIKEEVDALDQRLALDGDAEALRELGNLKELAGDDTGARDLYAQAVDRGDSSALRDLVRLRENAKDHVGAERILRFGLADDGRPARPTASPPDSDARAGVKPL